MPRSQPLQESFACHTVLHFISGTEQVFCSWAEELAQLCHIMLFSGGLECRDSFFRRREGQRLRRSVLLLRTSRKDQCCCNAEQSAFHEGLLRVSQVTGYVHAHPRLDANQRWRCRARLRRDQSSRRPALLRPRRRSLWWGLAEVWLPAREQSLVG